MILKLTIDITARLHVANYHYCLIFFRDNYGSFRRFRGSREITCSSRTEHVSKLGLAQIGRGEFPLPEGGSFDWNRMKILNFFCDSSTGQIVLNMLIDILCRINASTSTRSQSLDTALDHGNNEIGLLFPLVTVYHDSIHSGEHVHTDESYLFFSITIIVRIRVILLIVVCIDESHLCIILVRR